MFFPLIRGKQGTILENDVDFLGWCERLRPIFQQ